MSSLTPHELDKLANHIADRVAARLSSRPKLVDRHGIAAQLGVSVPTIDRLRRDGQITPVTVGSRVMYSPDDVIAELREVDHE